MNIHPIFVHFPIALLTLYSFMEILQFPVLRNSRGWQLVKSWFVVLGALASFAALQTGEIAARGIRNNIIRTHSDWATAAVWFFAIVGILYAVRLINTESLKLKDWFWNTKYIRTVWMIISKITDWIIARWYLLLIIGIAGLVLISIVGALGGAIAYGPDADPFVKFIYNLFF